MRDIRHFLMVLCLLCIIPRSTYGQNGLILEQSSNNANSKGLLDQFLDANPKAIEVKILSEGTMAYLCADEENLFVRVSVGNPMLFMRMLMQGLTIRIDPTGARKGKYSIVFPSARDVQNSLGNSSLSQKSAQGRPDIGPLVLEMNKMGVMYHIKGKAYTMELSRSLIELDTENETLNYYILIPKAQMMDEKKLSSTWSLGLYLESPIGVLEGPRDEGEIREPLQQGHNMQGKPIQPFNDQELEKLMKKKINVWEKFSIDAANSVNLK